MAVVERRRDARGLTGDPAWSALTRDQSPLADAAWIESFVEAFGVVGASVHELQRDGTLVAAVPVVTSGRLARACTSLDNEHHPYWIVSGALDDATADALLEQLLADADYVFLRRLPVESAACSALRAAAARRSLPLSFIETMGSGDARMILAGSWDELRATLPKNFQRDLPRKRRQLEKQGALVYRVIREPGAALDAALAACFDVETRGWKGTSGSPIGRDPATLAFYTRVAQRLAATGRFALYLLELDGQVVAFEYSLRGGGHIEMLKLSFDPAYEKQSPGQVLRMMLLEDELARGEVRYYHLGRPSEWKLRWAHEVAPLCTLRIYADTWRGRAAHLAGPVLAARVKASPRAMALRAKLGALRERLTR